MGRAVLLGSLTLPLSTRASFPIKSLAWSEYASPRTIHFRVLTKAQFRALEGVPLPATHIQIVKRDCHIQIGFYCCIGISLP